MPDNILQANTDFGAQVIAATGKPTAPIHIGGRPLEDFSREELAADAAIPDQPTRGQSKSVALFEEAKEKLLFDPTPESNQVMDPSIAANRAYSESLITQQPTAVRPTDFGLLQWARPSGAGPSTTDRGS